MKVKMLIIAIFFTMVIKIHRLYDTCFSTNVVSKTIVCAYTISNELYYVNTEEVLLILHDNDKVK